MAIFFLIMGFGLVIFGFYKPIMTSFIKNWPTIAGKIIDTRIERTVTENGEVWNVIVGFEYSVRGRSYIRSQRLHYRNHYLASRKKSEYPDGSYVTVYYNPKRPNWAMLENPQWKIHPIIDLTFGILGILLVIAAIFNFLYY